MRTPPDGVRCGASWAGAREVSTARTSNGGMYGASGGAPKTNGTQAAKNPAGESPTFQRRWGTLLASGAVFIAVVVGLGGYALHERSSAARWRASSLSWQARADADNSQNQPSSVTSPTIVPPTTSVATATSAGSRSTGGGNTTALTAQPGRLTQIVNTVPSVTRGLEQCASAALATASDALNFAATFPNATTNAVNADSTAVSSVCGNARAAANTLDDLVNHRTP